VNRILIYRAGRIGDGIVAVPAIQALRRAYPRASLALVTVHGDDGGLWVDDVLGEFGWFDAIVTYRPAALRSVRGLLTLLSDVRRLHADVVVYLSSEQNSWLRVQRDRAFFALAGIPRFFGGTSECVTWYGRLRRADGERPFEVDRLLALARGAGATVDTPVAFDLPIGDAARIRVDGLLAMPGFDAGRPLVALCPGSAQPVKRWPIERYGEVGAQLIHEHGASLVVVGGSQEAAVAERLSQRWKPGRWLNAAACRLSTLEMAELLRRCTIYLGNDTGPMHVAAAVGTRCVAVFGAHYPERCWHPYGEGHIVLRHRPPCRNCFLTECIRYQSRCVTDTSVDDVRLACDRALRPAG
jgi:ADP-heptose:LPS heptosyltransferase